MARVLSLWIFYSHIGKSVLPCSPGHYTIVSRIHSFRSNCTTRSRSNSSYGFNSLSKGSSSHLPSLTAPGIRVLKDLSNSLNMDSMSGVPAFSCIYNTNLPFSSLIHLCLPKYGLIRFLFLLSVTLILLTIPGAEGDPQVAGLPGTELLVFSLHSPRIDATVLRLLKAGVSA